MRLAEKDILEAKKINELFDRLDDESKILASTYLRALRDLQMKKEAKTAQGEKNEQIKDF